MENDRVIVLPDGTVIPGPRPVGRPELAPGEHFVPTKARPFKDIKWTHELAIDLMLEHPDWGQAELGEYFGHTQAWVCLVVGSDAFQAKLAERRAEVLNPEVVAEIEERFRALAQHSISRLHKKLENPNASDNLVLRSVEIAAKALGLGVRPAVTAPSVQIAIVVPPKSEAPRVAERVVG